MKRFLEAAQWAKALLIFAVYAYLCMFVFEYFLGPMPESDPEDYQPARYYE